MGTIQEYWNTLQAEYHNHPLSDEDLVKLDDLILNDEIENIRNGVMLMSTLSSIAFCRYLTLSNDSMVLSDTHVWSAPLLAERALVEAIKTEQMWQSLYETGVFELMEIRAWGNVDFESLTDDQKEFCVRLGKEMVQIPAGDFMMGALEDDEEAYDDEKPRHQVSFIRDFLMGKYAVTQALWQSVMGLNPSRFKGANLPVEQVSWFDCVAFCNKLSEQEGFTLAYSINGQEVTCNWKANGYRLPTEAEWEYSARGGEYHRFSGSDNVDEVAWYKENSGAVPHPVGQKKPNFFGLYDMSGNAHEWCWDWFGDYSSDSQTAPTGPRTGLYRVFHGGSWDNRAMNCGVSYRSYNDPTYRYSGLGFRITRFVQ